MKHVLPFFLILAVLTGCSSDTPNTDEAMNSITKEDIAEDIKVLASDEFLGRQPSGPGEEKTINYLENEFKKIGLKPGNKNSFFQQVPLMEVITETPAVINIRGNGSETSLKHASEYVITSSQLRKEIDVSNAELVFAGYGIVASEHNWNDYEGADIKDKIAVVLVNDPGFATKDSSLFTGNTMTYYGRWSYKYEEAARQGAAGVLIVHETEPASYPWEVVRNGWTGPQFYLIPQDSNLLNCEIEGWINIQKAGEIFAQAGLNFEQLKTAAAKPGFKAVPMNLTLSINLKNDFMESVSNNVLAVWEGSERSDEFIIYTAHWDHYGMDSSLAGEDKIYNGAVDNATGTAALLEIAEAFTKLPERPKRSVLFLAVTAEEQGLLGSEFYARHPVYPLNKTVAVINMDAMNVFGSVNDITVIGYGNSELDDYIKSSADELNRIVKPDPEPQRGSYYRSDHFSFAKYGVPALYAKGGVEHIEKGEKWMREKRNEWTEKYYHKPGDEYDPSWWDLSGMVDDIKLLFNTGLKLAMDDKFPNWRDGNEFKSERDEMMSAK
ncbi:MAG: M28 family metallopeptidase [Ignavibacteriaceae bacterium]